MTAYELISIYLQIVDTIGRADHKLFHEMADRLLTNPQECARAHCWITYCREPDNKVNFRS